MALTEQDLQAIRNIIKEEYPHCPIPTDFQSKFGAFMDVFGELGNGDFEKGIVETRKRLDLVGTLVLMRNKIGNAFVFIGLTLLLGGIGTAIWAGVKTLVKR